MCLKMLNAKLSVVEDMTKKLRIFICLPIEKLPKSMFTFCKRISLGLAQEQYQIISIINSYSIQELTKLILDRLESIMKVLINSY